VSETNALTCDLDYSTRCTQDEFLFPESETKTTTRYKKELKRAYQQAGMQIPTIIYGIFASKKL